MRPLFIDEQWSPRDLRKDFFWEFVERYVWVPIACRHTNWTYKPLCQSDEKGNIVKGSRRRDPFVLGGA